ncbi:Dihydroorotate dehydrogenase B (NAD(+)), electron transfer subunit [Desulfonema limicola]|uniref:Dihydroorotate dehydrogenase B (NAD(+)), electron transfer subunit n=1 Tax=Desulfonema limicola TaxID=45656 RepID=A0A975GE52_9BACT|nr:dihydroorotate dehydrogenase electron transfer subunit [Desulfonema limicola]QTA77878.1 Dihydroorotate dehydrogenase B (NAD(+)), electron transfer subunit [Desulfonema limicola]
MTQKPGKVLWNTIECSGYYKMGIECLAAYSDAKPGQFVMVRISQDLDPMLRRPFSIHRLLKTGNQIQGIEILYKLVGRGTQKLSELKKGDRIELLGPLGNCFTIPDNTRTVFIAAGGIGVAPMYFLTSLFQKNGIDLSESMVFIGGRSKDDLLCMNDFFSIGIKTVHIATDDGSAGEKELVTAPLERAIQNKRPDIIYACGPAPMLKAVSHIAGKYNILCQVSIETIMACGMGACLGCAVHSKENSGKYFHACTDGPVFDAQTIKL